MVQLGAFGILRIKMLRKPWAFIILIEEFSEISSFSLIQAFLTLRNNPAKIIYVVYS